MNNSEDTIVKVSPDEFLKMIASGEVLPDSRGGRRLVVDGTVNLSDSAHRRKIEDIPECEILGDFIARGCKNLKSVRCAVRGCVFLDDSGVTLLGGEFRVEGDLLASGCRSLEAASGHVGRHATLHDSSLKELGNDFFCGGKLSLENCESLEILDCEVREGVFASGSALAELGPSFKCRGFLSFARCKNFHHLGRLRETPRDVYLGSSGIRTISGGFSCRGDLILDDVPHLERVGGAVGGKFYVSGAPKLLSIDNVKIMEALSIRQCPSLKRISFSGDGSLAFFGDCGMTEIWAGSKWKGDLALSGCYNLKKIGGAWPKGVRLHSLSSLTSLDEDFLCQGNFEIHNCPEISRLEGRMGGDAFIQECDKLISLGPSLTIGGQLLLGGGDPPIRSVGCAVEGNVVLARLKHLEETASTFRTKGDLVVTDCPSFRALKGTVEGNTIISDCPEIESISAEFECAQDLQIRRCPPLKVMNCRVGNNVLIEGGSVSRMGAGFACGGNLRVKDAPDFKKGTVRNPEVKDGSVARTLLKPSRGFEGRSDSRAPKLESLS